MKRRSDRHSTVSTSRPPRTARRPPPPAFRHRPGPPPPAARRPGPPPRARVAQIIDSGEASLLDVIDSLLNKGVMLNADIILALADVDLVYVRLSALLCAADRVFPRNRT